MSAFGICYLLNFDPINDKLKYAGMYSGSTLVNMFGVLFLILLIFIIHLIVELVLAIIRRVNQKENVLRMLGKIHYAFAFNTYMRIIYNASMFIFISMFVEIFGVASSR
jgi:hypothetical protein